MLLCHDSSSDAILHHNSSWIRLRCCWSVQCGKVFNKTFAQTDSESLTNFQVHTSYRMLSNLDGFSPCSLGLDWAAQYLLTAILVSQLFAQYLANVFPRLKPKPVPLRYCQTSWGLSSKCTMGRYTMMWQLQRLWSDTSLENFRREWYSLGLASKRCEQLGAEL